MMRLRTWLAALALALPACAGDEEECPAGGRCLPPGVLLSGRVVRNAPGVPFEMLEPLAGVDVRNYGLGGGWTTTDADGHYEIDGLATNAEHEVRFRGLGSLPTALFITTDERPEMLDTALLSDEHASTRDTQARVTRDEGLGALSFVIIGETGGIPGAAVTLDLPAEGPFYALTDRSIDPAATTTSERGYGYFTNVAPGAAHLVVTHPDRTCTTILLGWSRDAIANVSGGYEASVIIGCD